MKHISEKNWEKYWGKIIREIVGNFQNFVRNNKKRKFGRKLREVLRAKTWKIMGEKISKTHSLIRHFEQSGHNEQQQRCPAFPM